MDACVACDGTQWLALPNPRPDRSMLSDLRAIDEPLGKRACVTCGLVTRAPVSIQQLFESGYHLYDHPPGALRETSRQETYADWLATDVAPKPRSILDVGCGNGSLLLALGRRWPGARLRGVDPSSESVDRACAAGIDARCGGAGLRGLDPADLVVSVNVIEHVEDPVGFLRVLGTLVRPGGALLLVCPDGGRASVELLFADHLWSFATEHLTRLAEKAGLRVVGQSTAPSALGPFQMVRLSVNEASRARITRPDVPELLQAKSEYLHAWCRLQSDLLTRCRDAASLISFGAGEAAGLLRAYVPAVWQRVRICVADGPEQDRFGDLPVVDYRGERLEEPVLLAVRPAVQPALARRLQESGCSVIRWDDCIAV